MSKTQRELAARLATEYGIGTIKLDHGHGVVFKEGEIVKIYLPRSKRILGCGPRDRRVVGDLLCLFARDLRAPTGRSKTHTCEQVIFAAPDANFPGLTFHSTLDDGSMDRLFGVGLQKLFNSLPDTESGWLAQLGEDYFSLEPLDQLRRGVQYLRSRLEDLGEPFIKRPLPAGMTIEITGL